MIKLLDILKEITIQKKTPLGSGWQQSAYPYLKNPNYVIKKFDNNSSQDIINDILKYYLKMLKLYPKYIANIIPKENSKHYFQEKIDITKSQNDIWDTVIKVVKKAALDLEKKYKTPNEAYDNLDVGEIFLNANAWEDIKNINNIYDFYEVNHDEGIPMDNLFNDYIYDNYSKNIPLTQKLKPVWEVGRRITRFGSFHEDNLGYDKNGNFKIIDI